MLLPALNGARERAKITQCKSNLKQTGAGFLIYADSFLEYLPPLNSGHSAVGKEFYTNLLVKTGAWPAPDGWSNEYWGVIGRRGIWQCPLLKKEGTHGGYSVIYGTGKAGGAGSPHPRHFQYGVSGKISKFKNASRSWLYGDSDLFPAGLTSFDFLEFPGGGLALDCAIGPAHCGGTGWWNYNAGKNTASRRHRSRGLGGAVCFLDGHVDDYIYEETRLATGTGTEIMGHWN